MRMLACCLLLVALVSCEQPRQPVRSWQPYRAAPLRTADPAPRDHLHKQHERAITDMQREIRRLRDLLEKKEP